MGPAAARGSQIAQVVLQLEVGTEYVDLVEFLEASKSELGSYWQRGISRKRARQEVVDLASGEDNSEEGSVESQPLVTLLLQGDSFGSVVVFRFERKAFFFN